MNICWVFVGLSLNVDEIEWAEFKMYHKSEAALYYARDP